MQVFTARHVSTLQYKVYGGRSCNPHSQPWQASMVDRKGTHVCGAVLISHQWALTAAHCLKRKSFGRSITLLLGKHRVRSSEPKSEQRVLVDQHIRHPDYDPETLDHDLALLHLATPARLSQDIQPVTLPHCPGHNRQMCTVSGWGLSEEGYPDELQCLQVPILQRNVCQKSYGSMFSSSMMCAGYLEGSRDACKGDSGGPLVCDEKLQGIVSWGEGCSEEDKPGVYAKVHSAMPWIKKIIEEPRTEDHIEHSGSRPKPDEIYPDITASLKKCLEQSKRFGHRCFFPFRRQRLKPTYFHKQYFGKPLTAG
uniref:Peptidase S1 domain-containing protein n=1 Tax=Eptatretus burgeri TaxID=7764 RepID=A0A8C4R3F0_EPTBU